MTVFDAKRFAEAMRKAPEALFGHVRDGLSSYVQWFATNRMVRQARAALNVRSGALARSFGALVTGVSFADLRATVYTDSPYARLQEHGGTVRPKNAKALTIPMEAALTAGAGVTRGGARSFGFTETFIGHDKDGNAFIFRRLEGDDVEPLFRLVPQVTVPARLGFFRTWEDDADERTKVLVDAVDKTFATLGAA